MQDDASGGLDYAERSGGTLGTVPTLPLPVVHTRRHTPAFREHGACDGGGEGDGAGGAGSAGGGGEGHARAGVSGGGGASEAGTECTLATAALNIATPLTVSRTQPARVEAEGGEAAHCVQPLAGHVAAAAEVQEAEGGAPERVRENYTVLCPKQHATEAGSEAGLALV